MKIKEYLNKSSSVLKSFQKSESAECYGMGKIIRTMGFYPQNWPLYVATDHGPSQRDIPTKLEFETEFPVMFYHSDRLVKEWKKQSSKRCFSFLAPFVFYRRKKAISQLVSAKGTLAFPCHSTELIDVRQDIEAYINDLKNLPEEYQPVEVCLYYQDVEKGLYKEFEKHGFEVHTAGHIYDAAFVDEFYELVRRFKFATSNHLGSYAFYCTEMEIPFFLYGESPLMDNKGDLNCLDGVYDPIKTFCQFAKATEMFRERLSKVSELQIKFVNKELGIVGGASRLKLTLMIYYALFYWFFRRVYRKMLRSSASLRLKLRDLESRIYVFKFALKREMNISTHMTKSELVTIHKMLKTFNRDVVYLEIGSYLGASCAVASSATSDKSKMICIDTWGNHAMKYIEEDIDAEIRDTWKEFHINTSEYHHKIKTVRGWSYDVVEDVREITDVVDALLIDGDHSYAGVKKDWDLYSCFLKRGSLVAFHDTGWAEGVQKLIKENLSNEIFKLEKELPNLQIFRKIK